MNLPVRTDSAGDLRLALSLRPATQPKPIRTRVVYHEKTDSAYDLYADNPRRKLVTDSPHCPLTAPPGAGSTPRRPPLLTRYSVSCTDEKRLRKASLDVAMPALLEEIEYIKKSIGDALEAGCEHSGALDRYETIMHTIHDYETLRSELALLDDPGSPEPPVADTPSRAVTTPCRHWRLAEGLQAKLAALGDGDPDEALLKKL